MLSNIGNVFFEGQSTGSNLSAAATAVAPHLIRQPNRSEGFHDGELNGDHGGRGGRQVQPSRMGNNGSITLSTVTSSIATSCWKAIKFYDHSVVLAAAEGCTRVPYTMQSAWRESAG